MDKERVRDNMSKEKRRVKEEKEKQTTMFYYEILGSFFIIFSIIILGKLGTIGKIFTNFYKVLFGDWYWLFVIFLLFFGVYSLFMHQKYDFKSHRFIGFIFISIGVLSFSHFPVHNYIIQTTENYIKTSITLYKEYLNGYDIPSLGGGMIGSIIFYCFYYLFGKLGVILFDIIISILGLSLVLNKTLKDIFLINKDILKKCYLYLKSFNRFFRYRIGKEMESDSQIKIKNNNIPLKLFNDYDNALVFENIKEKMSEYNIIIKNVLEEYHIDFKEKNFIISYYVTTISYLVINNNYDLLEVFKKIKLSVDCESFFCINNNEIMIQLANNEKMVLSLKEMMNKVDNVNDYLYPIGIDYQNKIIEIDRLVISSMLLIGDYFVGIKNYIKMFIISLVIKKGLNNLDIFLFTDINNYDDINYIFKYVDNDIFNFFDFVKEEIEKRLQYMKGFGINSYSDYLKAYKIGKVNSNLNEIIVIINEVNEQVKELRILEARILYLNQLALKAGVFIIYVVRNEMFLNSTIFSVFDSKVLFKCNDKIIKKISNDKIYTNVVNNALYLEGNGDSILLNEYSYIRFYSPLITKHELKKIQDHIIKK